MPLDNIRGYVASEVPKNYCVIFINQHNLLQRTDDFTMLDAMSFKNSFEGGKAVVVSSNGVIGMERRGQEL